MGSLDSDYDLAIDAYTAIWSRYERAGLDGLTPPERAILLAWQFVGEVNNGGFRQFLSSPAGAYAAESPAALEEVGMPYASSLVRQALALDGPPGFPDPEALNALTDEFFGSPENPYELIASYVRRYIQELQSATGA
jgi:hypothetical protein